MKYYILFILSLFSSNGYAQQKFKIVERETPDYRSLYFMVNEKGETLKMLDSAKYSFSFNDDSYQTFAVFAIKGKTGWQAIDSNENILFEVYNTSIGEPSPDTLIEGKIRIVAANGNIGFASSAGEIIIEPRFEIVTSFYKGNAIIGEQCKKIPWQANGDEEDCEHYSISCLKQGYINDKGETILLGDYTFDEIQERTHWQSSSTM